MELTRVNPFAELTTLDRMLPTLFNWPRVFREPMELSGLDHTLAVDVFEKDDAIVVKAALPGIDPKDIDVSVNDGFLQISAESKREEEVREENYHRREYSYGKLMRSLRLPNNVDASKAKASFDNGMLRLTIPHTTESKARSIKISVR